MADLTEADLAKFGKELCPGSMSYVEDSFLSNLIALALEGLAARETLARYKEALKYIDRYAPSGISTVAAEALNPSTPPAPASDAGMQDDVTAEAVAKIQAKADRVLAQDTYKQIAPSPSPSVGELIERLEHVARTWNNEEAAEAATALKQQAERIKELNAIGNDFDKALTEAQATIQQQAGEIDKRKSDLSIQGKVIEAQAAEIERWRGLAGQGLHDEHAAEVKLVKAQATIERYKEALVWIDRYAPSGISTVAHDALHPSALSYRSE